MRKKGRFDTTIETTFQLEVIHDSKTILKSKPVHNVTTDAGREEACKILHQAVHGGVAGADYITVGSTNYNSIADNTALTGKVNADG